MRGSPEYSEKKNHRYTTSKDESGFLCFLEGQAITSCPNFYKAEAKEDFLCFIRLLFFFSDEGGALLAGQKSYNHLKLGSWRTA